MTNDDGIGGMIPSDVFQIIAAHCLILIDIDELIWSSSSAIQLHVNYALIYYLFIDWMQLNESRVDAGDGDNSGGDRNSVRTPGHMEKGQIDGDRNSSIR